jgi:hypothetical protein
MTGCGPGAPSADVGHVAGRFAQIGRPPQVGQTHSRVPLPAFADGRRRSANSAGAKVRVYSQSPFCSGCSMPGTIATRAPGARGVRTLDLRARRSYGAECRRHDPSHPQEENNELRVRPGRICHLRHPFRFTSSPGCPLYLPTDRPATENPWMRLASGGVAPLDDVVMLFPRSARHGMPPGADKIRSNHPVLN